MKEVDELIRLGYVFEVNGDKITFKFKDGQGAPDQNARPLLATVKERKAEALAYLRVTTSKDVQFAYIESVDLVETAVPILAKSPVIGLDTETTGLDPFSSKIRLLQLATPFKTFVVDLFKVPDAIKVLHPILIAPDKLKVMHNAKFDIKMLGHHLEIFPYPIFDTMIASKLLCLREKLEHNLKAVVNRYLRISLSKELQKSDWSVSDLTQEQLRYAAHDAHVLLKLHDVLSQALSSAKMTEVARLEFDVLVPTAKMELNGIAIHQERWNQTIQASIPRRNLLKAELDADLGKDVVKSPKKLRTELQRRGLKVKCTSENELTFVLEKDFVIPKILEWKGLNKLEGTYGKNFLNHVSPITKRIHSDFDSLGASSGRFSSSKPNLQSIPCGGLRGCLVAADGYSFVIADYSQIDLRAVADISGETRMICAYQQKQDLHALTASLITNKSPNAVTKTERQMAKAINFGLLYGLGARGLVKKVKQDYGVDMSESEAVKYKERFFASYPGLRRWQRKTVHIVETTGYVRTVMGRRLPKLTDEKAYRLLGPSVQGTVGEGLKLSLVILDSQLETYGARLVNCIHDEVLVEVPSDKAEVMCQIVIDAMKAGMQKVITKVPIEVTTKIGQSWGDK